MLDELGIDRGRVAKYVLLPEILPRIAAFFRSGLGNLAYYIAVVFNTVRILPDDHIYLRASSHGKFSVFQAFAAAADHITFNRKNIDKVGIFVIILSGIVILALQFILLILAAFTSKAIAAPVSFDDFFGNENYETDIVFRALDIVFGIPGIFNSSEIGNAGAFHDALHALFEFYSFGIMLVGVFIIIYLAVAIVLETAQSGVPFGKRFNKAWAPVRLILFFGLLLPTTHGLNLAQYVLLEAARLGSNLGTNAWLAFDDSISTTYLGEEKDLIAEPNAPDLDNFVSFMQIAKVCSWAEGKVNGRDIQPFAVFGKGSGNAVPLGPSMPSYADLAERADGGTIFIRFGEKDETLYKDEEGTVFPYCGGMNITIVDRAQPGSAMLQQAYLELIACMWHEHEYTSGEGSALPDDPGCKYTEGDKRGSAYTRRYSTVVPHDPFPPMRFIENPQEIATIVKHVEDDLKEAITKARDKQVEEGDWINDQALKLGWGGVGIWYNKIAEQNGVLTAAVFAKPEITAMPYVMEFIRTEKMKQDPTTPLLSMYSPILSSGKNIQFEEPQQRDVAIIMNQVFLFWGPERSTAFIKSLPHTHHGTLTGNAIIDTINMFLGTKGLFDMCKNTDIHPLAQLASMGKGMVEHSIRSFGAALGVGVTSGVMGILGMGNFAQALSAVTGFLITFGGIGLILGFLLFYVIPMLPFIYFFFAVMTWIKSIFEAMVGMPLWALAHLRIGGEGMPGDAAASGYFHILEIFLRPVCIVLGFMGGIAVFSAMVKVLNEIFYLVIANLTGHEITGDTGCFAPPGVDEVDDVESGYKLGVIDEFFYTVVYAIVVYLIALPTFKMVDLVPDHIMRWFGAGITSFGAQDGDSVEGIMTHVSTGAGLIGQKLQGGGSGLGAAALAAMK